MKQVTRYESDDGQVFDTEEACKQHEQRQQVIKKIRDGIDSACIAEDVFDFVVNNIELFCVPAGTPTIAPYRDYKGNAIYAGDTIVHPSGDSGVVVYYPGRTDQWFVDYGGYGPLSRLSLQVGDGEFGVVEQRPFGEQS